MKSKSYQEGYRDGRNYIVTAVTGFLEGTEKGLSKLPAWRIILGGEYISEIRRKYCPICKDDMALPHGHGCEH